MKTTTPLSLFLLTAFGIAPVLAESPVPHGDPYLPVGTLNVSKRMVRTGVKPLLSWHIEYPENVTDVLEINPRSGVTPKKDILMEVRVVGAAFQVGSKHTPLNVQARVGTGSQWESVFYGADHSVDASDVVLSQIVRAGTTVDFAAKARKTDGSWYSTRSTVNETPTVQAMPNGTDVPFYVPAYEQGTIESFLSQYISPDNQVTVGPRDLVYLFELYATDQNSKSFDMQDIVMVVTFKDIPRK